MADLWEPLRKSSGSRSPVSILPLPQTASAGCPACWESQQNAVLHPRATAGPLRGDSVAPRCQSGDKDVQAEAHVSLGAGRCCPMGHPEASDAETGGAWGEHAAPASACSEGHPARAAGLPPPRVMQRQAEM